MMEFSGKPWKMNENVEILNLNMRNEKILFSITTEIMTLQAFSQEIY